MNNRKWRALIRKLRERFPVSGSVTVRHRPLKGLQGYVTFTGRDYRITVSPDLPWDGQVDALCHEWAHVIAIEAAYKHSPQWGIMYAEVYRAILDE